MNHVDFVQIIIYILFVALLRVLTVAVAVIAGARISARIAVEFVLVVMSVIIVLGFFVVAFRVSTFHGLAILACDSTICVSVVVIGYR